MKLYPSGLAVFLGACVAPLATGCSSSSSTAGSARGNESASSSGSGGGATSGSSSGSASGSSGGSGSGSDGGSGSTSGSVSSGSSDSGSSSDSSSSSGAGGSSGLHVSGGRIVDGQGNTVQLHGANETGSQTNCAYQAGGSASAGYPGFFDMPPTQAGVNQMLAWKINAVRVPLNEDCWLGINGLPSSGSTSSDYQSAIQQFVSLLTGNGLSVIVDLHWAGPGTDQTGPSLGQIPMADADHAVTFWTSVASAFKGNGSVIFDLYNEPGIADWSCWVSGAAASAKCAQANGSSYAVAGM
ncbi:MAG TPA: cellulase family glycosylhydrolase, partial [Polyangiaceae bacterium]|nr:cellulase family glycosylhydrolase [Polyangiaceae bacterium]